MLLTELCARLLSPWSALFTFRRCLTLCDGLPANSWSFDQADFCRCRDPRTLLLNCDLVLRIRCQLSVPSCSASTPSAKSLLPRVLSRILQSFASRTLSLFLPWP